MGAYICIRDHSRKQELSQSDTDASMYFRVLISFQDAQEVFNDFVRLRRTISPTLHLEPESQVNRLTLSPLPAERKSDSCTMSTSKTTCRSRSLNWVGAPEI